MNSKKRSESEKKNAGATEMREKEQERSELEEHLNWRSPSGATRQRSPKLPSQRQRSQETIAQIPVASDVRPNGTELIGKKSERIENCSVVLLVEWVPLLPGSFANKFSTSPRSPTSRDSQNSDKSLTAPWLWLGRAFAVHDRVASHG